MSQNLSKIAVLLLSFLLINCISISNDVENKDVQGSYEDSFSLSGSPFGSVAAGWYHSLLLTDDGLLYGWGTNRDGLLGFADNAGQDYISPVLLEIGEQRNFVEVAAGSMHSLALTAAGLLYSWGSNDSGQLGVGSDDSVTGFQSVELGDEYVIKIAAGSKHSLVLTEAGSVYSWGLNESGQLGVGTLENSNRPQEVTALKGENIVALAAGGMHSLALTADGRVYSWGSNYYGQLGLGSGSQNTVSEPVEIPFDWEGDAVSNIEAGYVHSLGLTERGFLYTWGENSSGQLGVGSQVSQESPVLVETFAETEVISISAGSEYSLALTAENLLYSWGFNRYGQLGLADDMRFGVPQKVSSQDSWEAFPVLLSAGGAHTIVMLENEDIYSWGLNWNRQLGFGGELYYFLPSLVELD